MKGEKYLFVVSGPSGTGKDTVVAALLKKHPEIQHTVSATTRAPRDGEKDGINYHFMSVADFEDHLAHDQIVEHTKYCENYYGTLRSEIEGRMKLGIPAKLVIEVDGSQHYEEAGKEADASRDDYLSSLGLRVLRYSNLDINRDFPAVCDDILNHLSEERTNAFPYEGKVARR